MRKGVFTVRKKEMTKNLVAAASSVLAVFLFMADSFADPASDSCLYLDIRNRVVGIDPSNQALSSADALFEAGLFTEAVELLREYAPITGEPAKKPEPEQPPEYPSIQWRLSSGTDYYHLEDFDDTVTMTPEELRDYKRLTETPLSVWMRAKASVVLRQNGFPENIGPEIYLSERKGRMETTARFSSPSNLLLVEPSVKFEKWFRADASGESVFAPSERQPSDMAGADIRLTLDNAQGKESFFRLNMPFSVGWEHRRSDRPGYESFVEYRAFPSFEISRGKLPLNLRLSGQAEFEDYYKKESDSLDVIRLSGRLEGNLREDKMIGSIYIAWLTDRYPDNFNPEAIYRIEGALRGEAFPSGPVCGRLRIRGIHETENFREGDGNIYNSSGSELTASAGVEAAFFGGKLHSGPELSFERRWGGESVIGSVWYGRTAFEPGLRIQWNHSMIDAALRAAYRSERFDERFKILPTACDNRSLRLGAETSASFFSFLSFDLFADYQYRLYAPYNRNSRIAENITISANITTRL